ncbi:MAG TPA: hypothetical protein VF711_11605, partial [Acidimicrobiales bacterium]
MKKLLVVASAPLMLMFSPLLAPSALASQSTDTGGASCQADPESPPIPATIVGSGTIIGTPGPDVIVGSPGPDKIIARGGDDVVCGQGGNDYIDGGDGNDLIISDDQNVPPFSAI